MLGVKARMGFIVPANNSIIEPELWRVLPREGAIYATRTLVTGRLTAERVRLMETHVNRAVEELVATGVDVIVFADMVTSFIMESGWNQAKCKEISQRSGVSCLTAWTALSDALGALGIRRIALGTPYPAAIHALAVPFFNREGFEVVGEATLDIEETSEVPKVSPERLHGLVRSIPKTDAEGIVLLATDLPTFSEIERIEKETGLPVLSSNQVLLWRALRFCDVPPSPLAPGRLFRV
jgi:arylmalonate decarboxylase